MLIEADYKNENSWAERTDWGNSAEICLMHFRWNWWNRLEWTLPSLWLWLPCRCELFWLRSAHNLFCAMTIRTKGVGCEGRQTTCESLHEKPSFNIHHMRLPDSGDHVEGIGTKLNGSKTQHNALHMLTLSWWQSTINWSWLSAKWMPQLRRGRCEHSTFYGRRILLTLLLDSHFSDVWIPSHSAIHFFSHVRCPTVGSIKQNQ